MNKQEVINLREELNKVLNKFNQTSDIKVELLNAKYGDEVTFKLVGRKTNTVGDVITKESLDFGRYSSSHGLRETALNYEFKHQNKTYKVLGYSTRAKRYPIKYSIDGGPYKCSSSYMLNIIKTSAPELLF